MGCARKVALSVSFLWFLLVVVSFGEWNFGTRHIIAVPSTRFLKPMQIQKKSGIHPNLNLNFVSKRRIPNGPDPIHNRYAFHSLFQEERERESSSLLVFPFVFQKSRDYKITTNMRGEF